MKLSLAMFKGRDPAVSQPDEPNSRLDKVVGRQRRLAGDACLGRLSRQSSDPSEEISTPLYGSDAYGGNSPLQD